MSRQGNHQTGVPTAAMIRQAPWTVLALALVATGIGGFVLLQIFRPHPAPSRPAAEAILVRAQAIRHRHGPLPILGQGFVRPRAEIRLTAEINAEVIDVASQMIAGGSFHKGDLLVRLDPRRFNAAIAQARGDLKAQKARLAFARKQLARASKLKTGGFAAEARVDELQSEKQQAEANIEALEARIAELELDLENTRITAPFDGAVRSESVEPGDVVRPGTEIGRIFATDLYEITVALDDSDAVLIPALWQKDRPAGPARVFMTYGATRYGWPAKVVRTESTLDERARTVNVVVAVPRPTRSGRPAGEDAQDRTALSGAPPLLVGSFADVVIDGTDPGPQAIVPRSALHEGNTAYVISPEDTLAIVPVDILYEDEDTAYLRAAALAGYERIIVSSLDAAIEGMAVRELSEEPRSRGGVKP